MKSPLTSAALGLAFAAALTPATWAQLPVGEARRAEPPSVHSPSAADAASARPAERSMPTPERLDTLPPATPLGEARGRPGAQRSAAAADIDATPEPSPLMAPDDPIARFANPNRVHPRSPFDSEVTTMGMPPAR